MNQYQPELSAQHPGQVKDTAIPIFVDAFNANIAGDQHIYRPASLEAWEPPILLPPRAQSFVGRDEDLAWLLRQLMSDAGVTLALSGPIGIGKTALVAEALSRLVAQEDWLVRFPGGIFYHSFYSSPSLTVAFEELAYLLGEGFWTDPRRAALRALRRRRTLLVFDGVEVLADALPLLKLSGKQTVLLLSRHQLDVSDPAYCRTLDLLSPNQAITLLQELAGLYAVDHRSVQQLVQPIGGYPLALQLIGSYLSFHQEEVGDYLHWFERVGLITINFGEHWNQSVSMLLQHAYDSLAPDEQHIFAVLSLLAPAPFPLQLIQGILELPEQTVQRALDSLVKLSVLRRLDPGYEVSHPLVHIFATERLLPQVPAVSLPSSDSITIWRDRLLVTLATHFEQSNPYDRSALALWQPHVFPLLSAEHLTAEQSHMAVRLFNAVGFDAFIQGEYVEAELLLLRALTISEQQIEFTYSDTVLSLNNLAGLYRAQGKYIEVEPLLQRALAISEQDLGTTHPDIALSLNNLAALNKIQSKYAEAEQLVKRALAIREQELGGTHPDTASSLNNLASIYQAQGKYVEAEPLLQRALAIREQGLGANHPDTAGSLNNLASLYEVQGKYAVASPLYQRALKICEQQLGVSHPMTQIIYKNYAVFRKKMGSVAK